MLHQFDAVVDRSSWLGSIYDILARWSHHFAKAYTDTLRTTAKKGGKYGSRGTAWPIKTGLSSRSFKYRVKDLGGNNQITVDIFNVARSSNRSFGGKPSFSSDFYAVDVESSDVTGAGNPNYNRNSAWNVLRSRWQALTQAAAEGLARDASSSSGTSAYGPAF